MPKKNKKKSTQKTDARPDANEKGVSNKVGVAALSEKQQKQEKKLISDLEYLLEKDQQRRAADQGADSVDGLATLLTAADKLLSQLVTLQNDPWLHAPTPSLEEQRRQLATFSDWITTNFPASFVGERCSFECGLEEGRGVVALQDLADGQQFMAISRQLCLTSEDAFEIEPFGPLLAADPVCARVPSLGLAVLLSQQSLDMSSRWRPYLDILPRNIPLPLLYPLHALLTHLKGSVTLLEILRLRRATLRQYLHVRALVKKKGGGQACGPLHWKRFAWAVAVVMSRQNRIMSAKAPGRHVIALIPGWDMCNYREGKLATYFNQESGCSESYTMEEVKKGAPIYIFYGDRPNHQLFTFQGFISRTHRADWASWSLPLSTEDPLYKIKKMALTSRSWLGGELLTLTLPFQTDERKDTQEAVNLSRLMEEVLPWCRLAVLDKQEAMAMLKYKPPASSSGPSPDDPLTKPISSRNEKAAFALLQSFLTHTAGLLPTTDQKHDENAQQDQHKPSLDKEKEKNSLSDKDKAGPHGSIGQSDTLGPPGLGKDGIADGNESDGLGEYEVGLMAGMCAIEKKLLTQALLKVQAAAAAVSEKDRG